MKIENHLMIAVIFRENSRAVRRAFGYLPWKFKCGKDITAAS